MVKVDFTSTGWCRQCQLGHHELCAIREWNDLWEEDVDDISSRFLHREPTCTCSCRETVDEGTYSLVQDMQEAPELEDNRVLVRVQLEGRVDPEVAMRLWECLTGGFPGIDVQHFEICNRDYLEPATLDLGRWNTNAGRSW
jgi:hypothetical protein